MLTISGPALAMIELSSIGRGLTVLDSAVKKAPVAILVAEPLSAGKFMLVFSGDVASTEEALAAGKRIGADKVIHTFLIPQIHPQVPATFQSWRQLSTVEALAIVETSSVAAAILAADAACKCADIELIQIRLAHGIGGKGFFTLSGDLPAVEAAVAAASSAAAEGAWLIETQIVPRPHADTIAAFNGRP